MKGKKIELDYQATSFIEGKDSDDHYKLEGDLQIGGIINCEKSIHCCKFHPSGELFAVGLSDGQIKIYRKETLDVIYSLIDNDIKKTRLPVTSIRFFNKPNDTNLDHYQILIASYVTGYIKFWHYPSRSCIYTLLDDVTQPLTIDFNMTFDTLAVAGYNDEIKIYDVSTKKLVNTLENSSSTRSNGHSSRIYCVKYNGGDRNQLVSGGWDDTLQIWDHRCAESQAFIYGPHVCGETLDIDPDHNHLLCGSWRKNNTLQIFDMRNFSLIRDVFKQRCPMMIYGAQWLGKGYIFTCGSEKNSAVIYDRGTLKPMGGISELKHAVTSLDNDSIGELPNMLLASQSTLYILKKMIPFVKKGRKKDC